MVPHRVQSRPFIRIALTFAMLLEGTQASALRVADEQASPEICQLQVLSSAQADIIKNCGSKNAVMKEWNECRIPIMEVAQQRIKKECCMNALGSSGCDDASLPAEAYEEDSPGEVPMDNAEDDSPA